MSLHRTIRITLPLEADATPCAKYFSLDLTFFFAAQSGVNLAGGRLEKFVAMRKKTEINYASPALFAVGEERPYWNLAAGSWALKLQGLILAVVKSALLAFLVRKWFCRAAPYRSVIKARARSIILMSIRRALIATRLINRELYL